MIDGQASVLRRRSAVVVSGSSLNTFDKSLNCKCDARRHLAMSSVIDFHVQVNFFSRSIFNAMQAQRTCSFMVPT